MIYPRVLDRLYTIREQSQDISAPNVWQIELDGKWLNNARKLQQEEVQIGSNAQ